MRPTWVTNPLHDLVINDGGAGGEGKAIELVAAVGVDALEATAEERMDEVESRSNTLERAKQKKLAALLSRSSTRANLMSVQTVLFGLTFMMSTFETGNR